MAKWVPSVEADDSTPHPGFAVGHAPDHRHHRHPPPPHFLTYDGLAHISQQVDDLERELAEIKGLLNRIIGELNR